MKKPLPVCGGTIYPLVSTLHTSFFEIYSGGDSLPPGENFKEKKKNRFRPEFGKLKHKVFAWLILNDRIYTKDMLKRRH